MRAAIFGALEARGLPCPDALRARDASAFLARLKSYRIMCWVLTGLTGLAILALDAGLAFLLPAVAYALAWPLTLGVFANELRRRALALNGDAFGSEKF